MSRITPPVSKLSRALSSTPSVARPSHALTNGAKAATNASKRRSAKQETVDPDTTRPLTTNAGPSRPTAASSRPVRKMPLMQGFKTSAPRPAATTHFAVVLPSLAEPTSDPYANIRVPLLPTIRSTSVQRPAEEPDAPLARPEILVVAANPENVMPAALTEVEGMGVDGVELKFAHELDARPVRHREQEQGMIRDIWKGLVDDVFAGGSRSASAV